MGKEHLVSHEGLSSIPNTKVKSWTWIPMPGTTRLNDQQVPGAVRDSVSKKEGRSQYKQDTLLAEHTPAHTFTPLAQTPACTHSCTNTCVHILVHTPAQTQLCLNACILVYTCIHTCTNTCAHTHMHTCTNTHTHTLYSHSKWKTPDFF